MTTMNSDRETHLNVDGMSCRSCVSHVHMALTALDGVKGVVVHLDSGRVLVRHDEQAASVADLIDALEGAGYRTNPAEPG